MGKAYHFQDGERCGLCFEVWPCQGKQRRDGLSGIQQWKLQTDLVKSAEIANEKRRQRTELIRLVREGLAVLDLDLGHKFDDSWPANGYMIKIEDLAELVRRALK